MRAWGAFVLPHEAVRRAERPDGVLLAFLHGTYETAAGLAGWDRSALGYPRGRPGVPRPLA